LASPEGGVGGTVVFAEASLAAGAAAEDAGAGLPDECAELAAPDEGASEEELLEKLAPDWDLRSERGDREDRGLMDRIDCPMLPSHDFPLPAPKSTEPSSATPAPLLPSASSAPAFAPNPK